MANIKKEKKKNIPDRKKPSDKYKPLDGQIENSVLFLCVIVAIGFMVRIFALMNLDTTIYTDFLLWDERIYHTWAQEIAEGAFQSKSVYEFAPLPAYIMAGIYWLFSPNAFYVRILNIICGALTCFVVYLTGKELAGRKVGILACILACLYKPFIFYSIVPLKESLGLLLFALMAYLLIKVINPVSGEKENNPKETGYIIWIGLLGLVTGLLLNVRPNVLVLIPVIILSVLWYGYRDKFSWKYLTGIATVYFIGFSIAIAPFVIRNYVVAGKLALTTSQSGFNLFIANNVQNPDPYYRPVPFASSSPFEQGIQFTVEASRRTGNKLTSQEASDYWSAETVKQAVANPSVFAKKAGEKLLVVFNSFEACDHYDINFVSNFAKFFKIPFPVFWMIFPLAVLGMVIGWKNRRSKALIIILSLYCATLVIFFTNGRYRLAIMSVMIPFAAMGIAQLYSDLKEKLYVLFTKHAAVCAVCLVITFLPIRATDDTTAYYNTHAIILASKGYINEAVFYWKKSSEMNRPFSNFANLSLAEIFYRRGNIEEGNFYFDKIKDDSFAAAQKYMILGDLLTYKKDMDGAVAAYEKSLSINSGQRATRKKLIDLYIIKDPPKAQNELETLKYIQSFYD